MAGASSTFSQEYNNNSNDLPGRTKGFAYAFVADSATAAFTAHTTAVRHLTTDSPKRHWIKELLCVLSGKHYVEKFHDEVRK